MARPCPIQYYIYHFKVTLNVQYIDKTVLGHERTWKSIKLPSVHDTINHSSPTGSGNNNSGSGGDSSSSSGLAGAVVIVVVVD